MRTARPPRLQYSPGDGEFPGGKPVPEPAIDFYRVAWGLDRMNPVTRESPDNFFDYYMLALGDTTLVERLHLEPLLRDRLSKTVLAKRADR